METHRVFQAVICLVLLIVTIATLGVTIAILVTMINNENKSSDSDSSSSGSANKVNVPLPKQISTGNENYYGYKDAVELFKNHLNATVSPCDDFYLYTCGNYTASMSFDMSDNANMENMVDQLTNMSYVSSSPEPVKQVAWYFQQCVNARLNWTDLVKDGKVVMNAINRVAKGNESSPEETRFPFYMLHQNETVKEFPNSKGLGFLFGYTSGGEGASNLLTPLTDTNWTNPHGNNGYAFFIDQPSTLLPYTYHTKAWDFFQNQLFARIVRTMLLLAKTQKIQLDMPTLVADAKEIVRLDHLLATKYSTDDTTRRNYTRSYNPMTIDELSKTYPSIDWHTFLLNALIKARNVSEYVLGNASYQYIVMEPDKLRMLNNNLGSQSFVSSRTIINYIYCHVVDANLEYLPWKQGFLKSINHFFIERPLLGRPRRIRQEERRYERRQHYDTREAQLSCAMETVSTMPYANARAFIDKIYPTKESREELRTHVAKMISSILIGFRTMLDQLNWMTPATKKGAYSKIDNLVRNIGYPDWITNDPQFIEYYKDIGIKVNSDDYLTIMRKIGTFNSVTSWNVLLDGPTKRQSFNGPPGTTNAWYQPQLNSITFPAGILHKPFYDPTWPTAVNFGALGVVAGHELTHGFDDEGVQWDGTGVLKGWMDETSKTFFGKMANCVVNEYDGFCPLNKTTYGKTACLDGSHTQGENIADNGGIHAAYRAYRNFINLYGPDPQLPDEVMQEFTSDQLFFLSFARVWCEEPVPDQSVQLQILVNPHSPSKYRVFGTIQNFAAFKDAFHCPSSAYAPDKHCDVWVSDIDSSYGEPEVKSETNIKPKEQITTNDINKFNAYNEEVPLYQHPKGMSKIY